MIYPVLARAKTRRELHRRTLARAAYIERAREMHWVLEAWIEYVRKFVARRAENVARRRRLGSGC